MLNDVIEILTKQMLKDTYQDRKNNKDTKIVMTKAEFYNFCIKLIKVIKEVEEKENERK